MEEEVRPYQLDICVLQHDGRAGCAGNVHRDLQWK